MNTVQHNNKEYTIVDTIKVNDKESAVLVLPEYVTEYNINGIDTQEGILKIDYNVYKKNTDGSDVYYIIDNSTGLSVGYYGLNEF